MKYVEQTFKVASVSEARPICPQGLTCTSSDPQHFMNFQHTPLEKTEGEPHPRPTEPKNFELPPKLADEILHTTTATTESRGGDVASEDGKRHSRSLSLEEEKKLLREKKLQKRKSLDNLTRKRLSTGGKRKSTGLTRDDVISLDYEDDDGDVLADSDDEDAKRDRKAATNKKALEKQKWEEMEKNLAEGGAMAEDLRKMQKEERKRMIAEAKRKKKEKEKEGKKKQNSKGEGVWDGLLEPLKEGVKPMGWCLPLPTPLSHHFFILLLVLLEAIQGGPELAKSAPTPKRRDTRSSPGGKGKKDRISTSDPAGVVPLEGSNETSPPLSPKGGEEAIWEHLEAVGNAQDLQKLQKEERKRMMAEAKQKKKERKMHQQVDEKQKWEELGKEMGLDPATGDELRRVQKEERKRMLAEAKQKKKEKKEKEERKREKEREKDIKVEKKPKGGEDDLRQQLGQELLKRFNTNPNGGLRGIEERVAANRLAVPPSTSSPAVSPDLLKKGRTGPGLAGTPVSLRPVSGAVDPSINNSDNSDHSQMQQRPLGKPPPALGALQAKKKSSSASDLFEAKPKEQDAKSGGSGGMFRPAGESAPNIGVLKPPIAHSLPAKAAPAPSFTHTPPTPPPAQLKPQQQHGAAKPPPTQPLPSAPMNSAPPTAPLPHHPTKLGTTIATSSSNGHHGNNDTTHNTPNKNTECIVEEPSDLMRMMLNKVQELDIAEAEKAKKSPSPSNRRRRNTVGDSAAKDN